MATTTIKQWTKTAGRSTNGSPQVYYYFDDDATEFGTINDKIRFNLPHGLPQDVCVMDVWLVLGRFDSHATPTGTWSVRVTDASADHEVIKDALIGRTAIHTGARPGERAADELTGIGLELTTTDWYIELEQTAALATATSSGRKVALMVSVLAVS